MLSASQRAPILPLGSPQYVLIEARGADLEGDSRRFESALERAIEQDLVVDAAICSSKSQRDALWALREDIPLLAATLKPMIVFDVSLPIASMETYLNRLWPRILKRFPQGRGVAFGHVGDCNVHLCWGVGADDPTTRADLSTLIYEELVPLGGSISAEHGIGHEKKGYLGLSRSQTEIEWMRKLKGLFDPAGILNAGRVF
jgi:FAD/FMN-containing dehydrogenase